MKARFLTMVPFPGPKYKDGRRTFQLHFEKRFLLVPGLRFYIIRTLKPEELNNYKPGRKYKL